MSRLKLSECGHLCNNLALWGKSSNIGEDGRKEKVWILSNKVTVGTSTPLKGLKMRLGTEFPRRQSNAKKLYKSNKKEETSANPIQTIYKTEQVIQTVLERKCELFHLSFKIF